MNLEPIMLLDGVELANSLRTLTYIRRGLSSAAWQVTLCDLGHSGAGYVDGYDDLYTGDSIDPQELCCFCHALYDNRSFDDPATDMAPWYDAARPESADFLGMLPLITLLPVAARNLTTRANGRGDVGPLRARPRIIQVEGAILAGSRAGMGYGERWLTHALSGSVEANCADAVLSILPYCPPEIDDEADYFRELHNVGIIDGPEFSAPVQRATCFYQEVSFQMAAGEPWLRRTTTLQATANFTAERCVTLEAEALMASAAAIVTIQSGVGVLDGVTIEGRSGDCPQVGTADVAYEVIDMPAGSTMTIDASKETVSVANTVGGVITGGLNYLDFTGLFEWLTASPGTSLCVCVDGTAATGTTGATVKIEMVELEL